MIKNRCVFITVVVISIAATTNFFICFSQNGKAISFTTFYPAPQGEFTDVQATKKVNVGEKSDLYEDIDEGTLYIERSIVLPGWKDTLPILPPEGTLINYYSSEGGKFNKHKIYFYDGSYWQELISLRSLQTKVLVWVDTSVSNVVICGKPAGKREWTECELGPNIKDTETGGCDTAAVYRNCTQANCVISNGGAYYGSPWGRVCFQVPDKKDFILNYSPTDARCSIGCCYSSPSTSCDVSSPRDPQDCWSEGTIEGYNNQICVYGGNWCGCYLCDCGALPGVSLVY